MSFWAGWLNCVACAFILFAATAHAQQGGVPFIRFQSGDYMITFDGGRAWTLWHMTYKGVRILSGLRGAANGTVVNCKPEGWIGTGHGLEEIKSLKVLVDGREHPFKENSTYSGKILCFRKVSSLRIYRLNADVTLDRDGVLEVNHYETVNPRPIRFIYAFMHSFALNMCEWSCMNMDGSVERGEFKNDNSRVLNQPVRWAAVFDPDAGVGALCTFKPNGWGEKPVMFFCDRTHDNKLYFRPDINTNPTRGEKMDFSVRLTCFESKAESWVEKAASLAEWAKW